ncbi:MAG: tripartite tricarboxylate transporter TctB family protein [Clostridia bacterium]|nr:tripartite tricarboxylate transporter TctB family protein [Clostridia bacterium]
MRDYGRFFFNILLLIFFLVLVIISFDYRPQARMLPLNLGLVGLGMVLVQTLFDSSAKAAQKLKFLQEEGFFSEAANISCAQEKNITSSQQDTLNFQEWWEAIRIFAWLIALVIALRYFNYIWTIFTFIFLIVWLEGKRRILDALYLATGVGIFMYLIFVMLLKWNI